MASFDYVNAWLQSDKQYWHTASLTVHCTTGVSSLCYDPIDPRDDKLTS